MQSKMTMGALALAMVVSLAATGSALAQPTGNQGIMVPLYPYPNSTWDDLIEAKSLHPQVPVVAIVNPSSGPGWQQDSNFAAGIEKLQDAGITVIGYVSTAYTGRDINSAKSDIDRWSSWYPVDGIFFDEQTNQAGGEWYYKELDQYAKGKGLSFTVGNPGANSLPSYLDTVDVVLIYESPGLPSLANYENWEEYDNGKLGMIPFGVSSLPQEWVADSAKTVGWIYVTDDVLPNPWDTLPQYFEGLMAAVEENNASGMDEPMQFSAPSEKIELHAAASARIGM
jgi:ABC-type sugar transport system substrate-binding protein